MLKPAYDDAGCNSNGLCKSTYLRTSSKVGQLVCRGNQRSGKPISFSLVVGRAD